MRVAVYLPEVDPKSGGGFTFQQSVHEALLAAAASTQHHYVIYSKAEFGLSIPVSNVSYVRIDDGVEARWLAKVSRALEAIGVLLSIRRMPRMKTWFERSLDEQRVELVWFATSEFLECNRPYVYTLWDLIHLDQPWFPEVGADGEWPHREAFHQRVLPRATRVILSNEVAFERLRHSYGVPRERVLFLPHPTSAFALKGGSSSAATQVRSKFGIEGDYLFYPAQFWPHKNHKALLLALKDLKEKHGLRFKLVLTGSDKGNRRFVERLVRSLGLEQDVKFLGFVSTDELRVLYQEAFALVFTSFCGPENLPPLEAFALGCPVVCSSYPGASEQLGDAALFFDPLEPEGIAKAVMRLKTEPALRSECLARGRKRAEARSPSHYVAGVQKFLDEFAKIRDCWPLRD